MFINLYDKQQPAPHTCGELIFELVAWSTARMCCTGQPRERWIPVCANMAKLLVRDCADPRASCPFDAQRFQDLFKAALVAEGCHPDHRARFTQPIYELGGSLGGRRLVFTKHRRLAVAPLSSQTDDEIWILGGSVVPVILRKASKGRYRLMGQAFTYGVMNGEAMSDDDDGLKSILLA